MRFILDFNTDDAEFDATTPLHVNAFAIYRVLGEVRAKFKEEGEVRYGEGQSILSQDGNVIGGRRIDLF